MQSADSDIPNSPEDSSTAENSSSIDWLEILTLLWSSRRLIGYFTAGAVILSIGISLIVPSYYRSTVTLLPETEKSKLGAVGGLSDLAALAGVNIGGEASFAKLYPAILTSESVLRDVIYASYSSKEVVQPVNLIQYYGIDETTELLEFEEALKELRDDLEVFFDNKTGIVKVSVLTKEPDISASIVNNVAKELDRFIRTKRTSNATYQREWIENRLKEVRRDLGDSEDALKEFREKNRRISDSPRLQLQQGRLLREVEINSTVYTELKKQYELVKIEEIKNIPVVSVMDSGRPAAKKDRPKRVAIVFLAGVLSLAASILSVAGSHLYGTQVKRLVSTLRGTVPGQTPTSV